MTIENYRGMNNLAYMYERGNDTRIDIQEAMRWYQKAANLGDNLAKAGLRVSARRTVDRIE
jgi:TPR repeat protein